MSFVAFGELHDDWFGRHAVERLLVEVYGIRHRVGGAGHPVRVLKELLKGHSAGHGVDDRGLVPEWHVLIEAGATDMDERRHTRGEDPDQARSERTESDVLNVRPTWNIGNPSTYRWFHREKDRPIHTSPRYPCIIDTRGIQVGNAVTIDVYAYLNHPHQLHQVHDRLPPTVAVADDTHGWAAVRPSMKPWGLP